MSRVGVRELEGAGCVVVSDGVVAVIGILGWW